MLNPNGVDESNILDSTNFDALGLNQSLVRALLEAGYTEPTPIQVQAIPKVIEGHDLLGIAQTGTGKTAAFSLPILHHLNAKQSESKARHPRALILAPTRELAIQIADSIKLYGSHIAFKQTSIFGGVGQNPQVAALKRGVDVIVATPGRLLDLVNQGLCHLGHIEYFVLDEADRMLDMGFIHDVKKIVAKLPRKRQTLFFSATMPKSVSALAGELLYKPVNVSVTAQATTVDRIDQSVIFTPQNHKLLQLVNLLSHDSVTSAIVFTRTKHRANRVSLALNKAGISSEPIHGNKSQGARQRALGAFKARMFLCQSHAGRDRLAGLIGQAVGVVFGVPSCLEKRVGGAKVMVKSRNQPAQLARKNALPVAVMRAVADAHKHLKQRKNRHISK